MKNQNNPIKETNNSAAALQEKRAREERKRAYQAEKKGLMKLFLILFSVAAILSLVTLLLTMLTDVVYVHNTDMTENNGREVSVRGIAFLQALFSGNFSSPDFDNIAVPFYLYAKNWCGPCAVVTLFVMILLIFTLILSLLSILFGFLKQEYVLTLMTTVFSALTAILTIVLYVIALTMKNGDILSTYCGGNPACSIRSDMIGSVICSLALLGCNIYATVRYLKLRMMRKARG